MPRAKVGDICKGLVPFLFDIDAGSEGHKSDLATVGTSLVRSDRLLPYLQGDTQLDKKLARQVSREQDSKGGLNINTLFLAVAKVHGDSVVYCQRVDNDASKCVIKGT